MGSRNTHDTDPFNLHRFVEAQNPVYSTVLNELRSGRKRTHWMWFIFPQIAGLGHSAMSQRYAMKSREEAHQYLAHPILGQRLVECTEAVLAVEERSAWDIFGSPDDMKLRSSMTLFAAISPGTVFDQALEKYFDGTPDEHTLQRLA